MDDEAGCSGSEGDDRGWVDYFQWTGDTEPPEQEEGGSSEWETVTYAYDPAGRRIAKAIDGQVAVRYVYDGAHCIAEYDANDVLLRKFIYGPGIDQPICMTEVQDANAVYYYHFDGLGSVIALSDASGDTVQTYEYDVYGVPAASDPNHPNPFLFTARRFDVETGLYHYRARAYNPYIGRFLQTDPAGQGMNPYSYCANDPLGCIDPSGQVMKYSFSRWAPPEGGRDWLRFSWIDDETGVSGKQDFWSINGWIEWAKSGGIDTEFSTKEMTWVETGVQLFGREWEQGQTGWRLSGGDRDFFWELRALMWLSPFFNSAIKSLDTQSTVQMERIRGWGGYNWDTCRIMWDPTVSYDEPTSPRWVAASNLVYLAHEVTHAWSHWWMKHLTGFDLAYFLPLETASLKRFVGTSSAI